jgi:hypothetical protein
MRRYALSTFAKEIDVSEDLVFQLYQVLAHHWRSMKKCCEILKEFAEREGISFGHAVHLLMKEVMEIQHMTTTFNPQMVPHIALKLTPKGMPYEEMAMFGIESYTAELRV